LPQARHTYRRPSASQQQRKGENNRMAHQEYEQRLSERGLHVVIFQEVCGNDRKSEPNLRA
jgi:hypothetical protein